MNRIRSAFLSLLLSCGAMLAQSGSGLTGTYFDSVDFTSPVTTRNDTTIYFGTEIPFGTAITAPTTYSIAWTGRLEPQFTETYTFYITANDGARLWVDDAKPHSPSNGPTPSPPPGPPPCPTRPSPSTPPASPSTPPFPTADASFD